MGSLRGVACKSSPVCNNLACSGLASGLPQMLCMGAAVKPGSRRANALMGEPQKNERRAVRVPLHVAALAQCPQLGHHDVSALIRDVTTEGVFFFAQFVPTLGAEISLSFHSSPGASSPLVYCTGEVVRIEQFSSGAAGIALKLHEYHVREEAC